MAKERRIETRRISLGQPREDTLQNLQWKKKNVHPESPV